MYTFDQFQYRIQQNGIAGLIQSITNNAAAANKPEFIFDHVSSVSDGRSKHLFDFLQVGSLLSIVNRQK